MHREGNEALLGIFFGRLGAEVERPLLEHGTLSPNAHPLALELSVDLHSLTCSEPGRASIQAWQVKMRKLVMDGECRALFSDMDLGELRMRAVCDAECPVWELAYLRDHAETEGARFFNLSVPRRQASNVNFVRPR